MAANPLSYGPLSEEEFIALFPVTSNRDLCALTGLTAQTVSSRGHKLGLRKARFGASGGPGPRSTTHSRTANFWSHVDKGPDCWLWTGARLPNGYGKFNIAGRTYTAHRASWLLTHGDLPNDRCVLHRCDVRACVRPEHLFLGTLADNSADMKAKGRMPAGEAVPHARLREDQVRQIRARYDAGEGPTSIARSCGVSEATVRLIGRRQTWRHVR